MHIAVVGSGHVGLVAGACFAELGHQVVVVDNDPGKLAALQAGEALIHERHLPVLLERHRGRQDAIPAPDGARIPPLKIVTTPKTADWEEFSALDLDRMHAALKYPIVIDGRNLFDPDTMREHGFQYFSVGRPAVNPKEHVAAQGKNA